MTQLADEAELLEDAAPALGVVVGVPGLEGPTRPLGQRQRVEALPVGLIAERERGRSAAGDDLPVVPDEPWIRASFSRGTAKNPNG